MNRRDLANKIWSACDIVRRDDGTTSILDYMEQLSWMIFLKVFEDVERRFEDKALFEGKEYSPIIDYEYRWHLGQLKMIESLKSILAKKS